MSVRPIPEAYSSPTPYLIVTGASDAIEWYSKAFGATEHVRLVDSTGHVMHAEIRLGSAPLMLADEFPDSGYVSPETLGGSAVLILVFVQDVDSVFQRAIGMGAVEKRTVRDEFDGDRRGTLVDPFGHVWLLANRREDVPVAAMKDRFAKLMGMAD